MSEWFPIETAPKNKHVIVAVPHGTIPHGPMRVVEAWWGTTNYDRKAKRYNHGWVDHPGHEIAPTHWTPLPAPPGSDAMLAAAPPPPGSEPSSALAEAMEVIRDLHDALQSKFMSSELQAKYRKPYEHPLSALDRAAAFLASHSKGE